ncbi:MAG: insulinase family protein [Heliobacteriaceae bacterium]|nr:insulinase family protein [Heliobacteriaceae bacterium]
MLKVSAINMNSVNRFAPAQPKQPRFTSDNINGVQDAVPDYSVNTPISYRKTGELNLPYDIKAHCYKLSNGQQFVIVPQEGETVLKTYVNSGSMNEPDKVRGISHYIEHNLFNGSKGLEEGDFFKAVDGMGAATNASTGFAETNYYIKSNLLNNDDLENQLKIHASMLETPLFPPEKLKKEKGIVNSEINMILSRPENLAINKTLKNLYNIKSTSVDLIGGSADNINNITREDVVEYYNNNYYPANMVTVITGEVTPEDTMKLVSKYFNSKKQPPAAVRHEELKPLEKTVREDIISDKSTATDIVLGFNGPANNNSKEQIYMDALSVFLTGSTAARLNNKTKQFNTSANMCMEKLSTQPADSRAVILDVRTTEENSEKILKTLFNEIQRIQVNPPDESEMQIVKKSMLKNFSKIFEDSFRTNNIIGTSLLDGDTESLNNFEQIVNSMTAQDLAETAKKYLDLNKTAITVLHPAAANEKTISANYGKAIAFTGTDPKKALNMDNITHYELPNNIQVSTNDIRTRNSFMQISMLCDKPIAAKPAAYFILNNLLNEGSAFSDEQTLTGERLKNGITQYISSGSSRIDANVSFDANDTEKALQLIKDVLQFPRFSDDAFTQAKNDLKEGILIQEKSAYMNLDCELFKGQLRGISNKEILDSLNTVTMQDVIDLYGNITANAKMHVAVSAPFSKKPELANVIFREFGSFKPVKKSAYFLNQAFVPVNETKVITEADCKNQAEIVQAYKFQINDNIKDTVTLSLLNTILGRGASSRLFNDLREQQKLAYHVGSDISSQDDFGVIELSIGTTTENAETGEISYDNLQKSLEGFKKHINKMVTEKVSEDELKAAKLKMKNHILSSSQTASDKASSIICGLKTPYGISFSNQMFEMIDKITADDIYNAANYIFAGKPTYSIVATENTLKQNKEFLDKLKISE